MNHLRNVGRNIRPDYWARYFPYYYSDYYTTPPQGYYLQPSPLAYQPILPSPYAYASPYLQSPYPSPHFYPYSPRYQHPQLFSSYSTPGQLPVVNRNPHAPTQPETPQFSPVPDVHMHPELWWNSYWTEFSRGIIWDVALPPSEAARLSTPRHNIIHLDSGAHAITTERRIDAIELWTDHPHLTRYMHAWGPVSVSETTDPTILQILQTIYDYLNTPLTNEDYRSICSNPHNFERLEVSRDSRTQDGFDAVFMPGPFRRLDVIGGHRRFLGIRVVKLEDHVLTLHFNLGPGPVPPFY